MIFRLLITRLLEQPGMKAYLNRQIQQLGSLEAVLNHRIAKNYLRAIIQESFNDAETQSMVWSELYQNKKATPAFLTLVAQHLNDVSAFARLRDSLMPFRIPRLDLSRISLRLEPLPLPNFRGNAARGSYEYMGALQPVDVVISPVSLSLRDLVAPTHLFGSFFSNVTTLSIAQVEEGKKDSAPVTPQM